MRRRPSLRLRVALAFAGLGAVSSLLLATALWFAAHDVSRRLMDETLDAEMADYMARRARNPHSLPPATASLTGYFVDATAAVPDIPSSLRSLPPGRHEIILDMIPYRVQVAAQDNARFILLFNETRQQRREEGFLLYLVGGALCMTLFAALGGSWLARRVIAPVTQLARSVSDAQAHPRPRLATGLPADEEADEIEELARAFDRYVERLAAFIDRERAFAADASHELRTPLAVIQGAAEVLAEDPELTTAQRQRIARIERAALEMTELITALLLLAREEDVELEADCDARRVVIDNVERYRPLAANQGTTITLDAQAVTLAAHPALFAIVVANLIRNAVTHTRASVISITLDATTLTVHDDGVGIDDAVQDRLFERHARGPQSTGSGIGLSLVKRICDRLHWRIELRSGPASGTTVTLSF